MAPSIVKRLGFARKNTAQAGEAPVLHGEPLTRDSASDPIPEKYEKETEITGFTNIESEVEANRTLKDLERKHRWDPNFPSDTREEINQAEQTHDLQAEVTMIGEMTDNSPYPEVRAAVRNYDEDLQANTIRMWTLGLFLTTLGSGMNMLFSMRSPSITVSSLVAALVAYPLGYGWSMVMPNREMKLGRLRFNLNPCPFNMKEHCVIVVMANCTFGFGAAYSTDTILAMRAFYGQNYGVGWELIFTFSTQMIGYGIAGLLRKFLVYPAAMIWPYDLVSTSLFYALHDHSKTDPAKSNGWQVSRYRYFLYVFLGGFVWYWFPGFIAKFLSVFAFVTWIKPNNVVINQLFGGWTGLSLIPITFDWSQIIGYRQSPLVPPWHAIANTMIGLVTFYWITSIALHYSGHWYAVFLPMSDSNSYDNTGKVYNVSRILNSEYTLDLAKYEAYSPLFLSTTFSLSYGLSFAAIASVIVHTALFHSDEILKRIKSAHADDEDIHMRMMRKYKDAPSWWYMVTLVLMIGLSLATALAYDTHLTWWAFFVAIIISFVWSVPIGMIQAITNIQLGLNVFTEFIIGYMQPGRPLAMMMFKTYGYITMTQALYFTQDLKLGHYMKVSPRLMFAAQTIATIWSCIVQIGVLEWALGTIKNICTPLQVDHYTCPGGRVFFNASVIWGVIGPQRMFSPGSIYSGLLWFWLVGALLPVAIYFGARAFPRSNIRFLLAPIIFGSTGSLPPATPLNYLSWGIVGFVFNKYIKNRYRGWWMRFNYVTSAGLDVGLAIATIVIFLTLNLTQHPFPAWWGNTAPVKTMDYLGTAVQQKVAKGEHFGPDVW